MDESGQILALLNEMSQRLAVVETELKALVTDVRADIADHETRLRAVEAQRLVTVEALEERDAKRTTRFWVVVTVVSTVFVALVVPVEAIVLTHLFG